MTDWEKVIGLLSEIAEYFHECQGNASVEAEDRFLELQHAATEASELLKGQEPRLMTLEELLALPNDTPVFIEENNGECGWNVFYGIDEENDVCFCGFKASADYYDVESYGQEYICWTSRPTEEQRGAVKWDD